MKVKTHPKNTNLNKAVTLTLSLQEALALADLAGDQRYGVGVSLYIALADGLEADTLPEGYSISRACSELLPKIDPSYRKPPPVPHWDEVAEAWEI